MTTDASGSPCQFEIHHNYLDESFDHDHDFDDSFDEDDDFDDSLDRVGKKWEPRNPVPGPFSAKIRKVNQNSESRQEFGK